MNDPSTQSQTETQPRNVVVKAVEANEWGQITGLEAKAPYFIIRKPTAEYTRERSKEFVEQTRAFLHEHRVLTEQQMKELNEKYGEPAKAKVNEVRQVLEKRFDEIAKEIEARVSKLTTVNGEAGETPGEMPTGGNGHASANATETTPRKKPASKKSE